MFKEMGAITTSGSAEYNFHHNILIDSTTTFNQYYKEVGEFVNHKLEHGYGYEVIEYYKVKVWNLDIMKNSKIKLHNKGKIDFLGYRSYSTSVTKFKKSNLSISPIKVDETIKKFSTMDIETIDINGIQTPIAISTCNAKTSKLFVIDHLLLQTSPELVIKNLWKDYFEYILSNLSLENMYIFAHNLGNFDGYYLYKGLINHFYPTDVESLIDESKSFISISLKTSGYNTKIIWKDSLRIFPISLAKLCQVFEVSGKLIKYDMRFNDLSLFNKPTIPILGVIVPDVVLLVKLVGNIYLHAMSLS